jgi:hypothetical protein
MNAIYPIEKLMAETGLTSDAASDLWRHRVLSGYRSWKPWVWFVGWVILYFALSRSEIAFLKKYISDVCLFAGAFGSYYVACLVAYPRIVIEGKALATNNA